MKIVLDTNVLVSGMLSPHGPPAAVLRDLVAGHLELCFDERILITGNLKDYPEDAARMVSVVSPREFLDLGVL